MKCGGHFVSEHRDSVDGAICKYIDYTTTTDIVRWTFEDFIELNNKDTIQLSFPQSYKLV